MNNSKKTNVLILALSGIGNLIMQMPALETLKRKRPQDYITVWVAPRGTKALAQALPYVDEVMEAPIKGDIAYHLSLIQKLRSKKFDVGIVLSPGQLVKSAAYLFLSGIPQRIGNSYPVGKNSHSSFLLTDAITEEPALHDLEQNLNLLKPLGITPPPISHYSLVLPASNEAEGKKILDGLNLPVGKVLVGFHMGSAPGFEGKRWPLENFIALGKKLQQEKNAHILLFGGPDEAEIKEEVAKTLGNDCSVISAPLLTTAAIMKSCQQIVSNDSGLMHLAAAVGVPVLGLFGPTDEKTTGPRGLHSSVLRAPGTKPVYSTEGNPYLGSEPHLTMKAISVEIVFNRIRAL